MHQKLSIDESNVLSSNSTDDCVLLYFIPLKLKVKVYKIIATERK